MSIRSKSTVALALIGLSACVPTATIRSNYDHSASFPSYRIFGFVQPAATDREGYESLTTAALKRAVTAELESRGYAYSQASPDLLVNFRVDVDRQTQISALRSHGSCTCEPHYGNYDVWENYEPMVYNYDEGRLSIDLVDARRKKLLWEAEAVGVVTERHRSQPEQAITTAIHRLFLSFPVPAPAGGRSK